MQAVKEQFERIFSGAPKFVVQAPGRVNLIGEHVDYCDGFVLPMAMSQALYVAAEPSPGDQIEVYTTAFDERIVFSAHEPGPPASPSGWGNYVRGVAQMLRREGVTLGAGRLLIHSEVPLGGGVSSSAALEVGCALAYLTLAGQTMEPVPLALLARQAEHEYAGSPCGIMDQFICVLGKKDHALLLDCRSQAFEQIPMPLENTVLAVMNTQVKHEIGSSEYPVRQRQCREGLAAITEVHPPVASLRDVAPAQLAEVKERMDPVAYRRCRHVVTEIERTQQAGEVLRRGDLATFGELMVGSHVSLRDDYEVSCKELDALVEIATSVEGVHGARMTGGGFGGCAIALVDKDSESALMEAVEQRYNGKFAKPAICYTTVPADGAFVHTA